MTDVTTIHQPVLLRDCVDLVVPALARQGRLRWIARLVWRGIPRLFSKRVRKRV